MSFKIEDIINKLPEVQNTTNWRVTFTNPKAVSSPSMQNLMYRCKVSNAPVETYAGDLKVQLGSWEINYPGKTTRNGTLTLTFVEGTDGYIASFEEAYAQAKTNQTTGVKAKTADLKFTMKLEILGTNDEVVQTYDVSGCLLAAEGIIALGQDDAALEPNWNITYDTFKRVITPR